MKLEVEVETGDIIIFNGNEWKVSSYGKIGDYEYFYLEKAGIEEERKFTKGMLQEKIKYSGQFKVIKEDYIGL